ncbi:MULTISPECIES: MFS transporter [unclassified Undibacterium]|uniref:MFS transporter n=1 Tax=unclassified Undibacterium TaxID=2630295 RepID=UPI002AC93106|nr:MULTISPECIES: MFS transporter [unclassified Undibacterium]MEB0138073.1 MFS transporter [Undibacterium sp. CCC2.1]MEB0171189.1 MFS transporter [Undibacterium sp. CCC1.1]MEB0175234.1 MFS transporter [Undibacterium sp. CCC3.4]MEB0214642.1 MFS transporter [Undibacterium sp. 5I2]WPX42409.1 MFS transporter [Undibacterium sp. CCC3.4]
MQPTTPPARLPALAIPVLSLAALGSGISLRVMDPLLPLLVREFGITLGTAAQAITVFAIAYGVSQLFFGPLGDRFGKYLVIAGAALACALSSALCLLADEFHGLLLARAIAGITAAAIIPLSMAWIGDVTPYERRQPVLARFLIGQIFGLAIGVLGGGIAADAGHWRWPFLFMALLFAVVGCGLLLLNARLPPAARQRRSVSGSATAHMWREFRAIAMLPWARLVLATVFLEGAFLYGPFAFIASHLHHTFAISLTLAGSLIMLYGLGGFVFAMNSRRLLARLGETGLTRWGSLILAASIALIGLAPAWWWAIPACFCAGLGFYMLHNTLQIHATQMSPERRGAAVSAFSACFFLGQSLGVALAGRLIGPVGSAAVLLCGAAGIVVLGGHFSLRIKQRDQA